MAPATLPDPGLLGSHDWQAVLDVVADFADALDEDGEAFARCGIERLPRLAPAELTTLSLCDLRHGRRHVFASPGSALGAEARASFDRHFHDHPLVRYHAYERGGYSRRVSDSVPFGVFRNTSLYNEYYRSIGIDHVLALPVMVDGHRLVSFVLNRSGRDFGDLELARIDQVRGAIGRLFRRTRLLQRTSESWSAKVPIPTLPRLPGLSEREHDVLRWVAAGKTDRDIAEILHISPRTVHKHLQRVYAKLGVETRTAAVMRALSYR